MYRYLFDTNIYRILTTSKDGMALRKLNHSLSEIEPLKMLSETEFGYKLTPYTLLEAVGLKEIPYCDIEVPNSLKTAKSIPLLVDHLMKECYQFYSTHLDLSKEHISSLANAQSIHTDLNIHAKKLEQICVYDPISYPTFQTYIAECLSFDFVCKQDYPQNLIKPLSDFLLSTNLYHCSITSLSKFRLVKLHWQSLNHLYKKDQAIDSKSLEDFETSMKLKKKKDYLDCDLIHLACLGDYVNYEFHPVVIFTCDDRNVIVDRIMSYRAINKILVDRLVKGGNMGTQFIFNKWSPGIVAFCNQDGSINDVLEVDKLPINSGI